MREKEKEKTDRFIESLYYFEVTREIAKLAGQLRRKYTKKGKTLSTTDVIVAATAITYGLTLITKNIKHYPFPELKIDCVFFSLKFCLSLSPTPQVLQHGSFSLSPFFNLLCLTS